jgi:hypothetical protein
VTTHKGIVETRDGGENWRLVTGYPADTPDIGLFNFKFGCRHPSIAYEPTQDVFYLYLTALDAPKARGTGQLLRYVRR